jgi:hypothetical protein
VDLPGALKRMAWLVLPPFFGLRLQGGTYMVRLNFSVFISAFAVGLASAIANASVPNSSTQINVQPRAISASGDCSRVPQFLVYLMAKCFPEAYVDLDRARLTGLVETLWTAKNLKVEKEISTCK